MTESVLSEKGLDEPAAIYALLTSIDGRLARLEAILSAYEPLLAEAARRMAGPLKWKKER